MKDLFRSIAMAFSMFSVLPTPNVEWKDSNMKYMLCALPLVGVFAGGIMMLWYLVCDVLAIGKILYSAGMVLIPLFVSGGIHMDGFCDTVDALASHAPAEKKRAILKDSNAGAFAIIFALCYFILVFALCTESAFGAKTAFMLCLHQVFSRAVGALAGVMLPSSSQIGLLSSFKNAAAKKASVVLLLWCGVCALCMSAVSIWSGIVCTLSGLMGFLYIKAMSRKQFGGMSGDLAGYIITVMQAVLLLCFVLGGEIVEHVQVCLSPVCLISLVACLRPPPLGYLP